VHVAPQLIDQFTYNLTSTLKQKERAFQEAMKYGGSQSKDFAYGTLPSLMKVKALQEKERQSAMESRLKRNNASNDVDSQ
jgi:mannose/fructose/N-acetylgalactosamine-specific phosphotransferase system component IID